MIKARFLHFSLSNFCVVRHFPNTYKTHDEAKSGVVDALLLRVERRFISPPPLQSSSSDERRKRKEREEDDICDDDDEWEIGSQTVSGEGKRREFIIVFFFFEERDVCDENNDDFLCEECEEAEVVVQFLLERARGDDERVRCF